MLFFIAKEKKKLPIDFPSIWVHFSCILKVASFRIRWRSPTRSSNIAYANTEKIITPDIFEVKRSVFTKKRVASFNSNHNAQKLL